MENNTTRMTSITLNNTDGTDNTLANNVVGSLSLPPTSTSTVGAVNNINLAINRYNLPVNNTNNNLSTTNNNNNNNNTNNNTMGVNDIIKTSSTSPVFSTNMSTLPSMESVTAAISSIGANFNEDAIYAELTSQEDNRGYVRRPMNAFMVWSKQARRRIALAYPNLLNCEISKLLGREWGRMSSQEKEPYVALSTKLRENHNLLHPDYTYKPRKRRRKGENKSINDFDSGVDSHLVNLTKGYQLQNPLFGTNFASFYTSGGGGGGGAQQRYINPSFNPNSTLSHHHSNTTSYIPYTTSNNAFKNYATNNSVSNLNLGLPPLNFQNGYMMSYQNNKMTPTNNPLNLNSSQFYPSSGSSYFPSLNNTTTNYTSTNSNNSNNNISSSSSNNNNNNNNNNTTANATTTTTTTNNNNNNNSLQSYFNAFDSAKIGSILNIYGHEDDLTTTTQSNDNTPGNMGISQNNFADLTNFCASTIFNPNINNNSSNTNSISGNQANFYSLQSQSNVIQQLESNNNGNGISNDSLTPISAQSSSRQRPSSKNQ